MSEAVIRSTLTPCKECLTLLPAQLVEENGNVYLDRTCDDHGHQRDYYWKNADRFRRALKLTPDPTTQPAKGPDLNNFPLVRGVCIDLTTRCNLPCPTCFADANRSDNWEPDINEIRKRLRGFSGDKPIVYLIGGEPTLRKDLPEIIAMLVTEGFTPKLVTNGLKIADPEYLKTLHRAGLQWVFLQFDGFRKDTSIAYRSRDIRDYKERAIRNMAELDMKILLACMVEKEFNDDELGEIIRFAADHEHVCQVAFLPASDIGRKELVGPESETMMEDVFVGLEQGLDGQVSGNDFLSMMRINRLVFRLTRKADFFPKTCFMSIAVFIDRGRIVPINRLLNPINWVTNYRALLALLVHGWRLPFFEKWQNRNGFLVINIEKFRSSHNFDWTDAHSCSKVYMRREGWTLSCMHNAYTRNDYDRFDSVPSSVQQTIPVEQIGTVNVG